MTQYEVIEMFSRLGFICLEDNIDQEVKDLTFYSRFGNDQKEIQFKNVDGDIKVIITEYKPKKKPSKDDVWHFDNNEVKISADLALAIVTQVNLIKEIYAWEIEQAKKGLYYDGK